MQKSLLQAGLSGLVAMALTSNVLGQTDDSSMHSAMINSPHYSIRIEKDKVVELLVEGRKIPADSFYVYDAVIRKLRAKVSKDQYQAKLDKEKAEMDHEKAGLAKEQAERDRIGAEGDKEKADRDKEQADLEVLKLQKEEAETRELQQMSNSDRLKMEQDMQQSKRNLEQAILEREKAERDRKLAAEDREVTQRMIGEMVKDGLVPDEQSIVSITLNQDEFLLNGKKQPDAVHKKYATRFLVKPGYKISYHHDR